MKRILLRALVVVSGALLVLGIAGSAPPGSQLRGRPESRHGLLRAGQQGIRQAGGHDGVRLAVRRLNGSLVGINIPLACHNKVTDALYAAPACGTPANFGFRLPGVVGDPVDLLWQASGMLMPTRLPLRATHRQSYAVVPTSLANALLPCSEPGRV